MGQVSCNPGQTDSPEFVGLGLYSLVAPISFSSGWEAFSPSPFDSGHDEHQLVCLGEVLVFRLA